MRGAQGEAGEEQQGEVHGCVFLFWCVQVECFSVDGRCGLVSGEGCVTNGQGFEGWLGARVTVRVGGRRQVYLV